ncbi:MAG: oligosaccharide flippase family protein [Burkholderiales bacterium]|jgi:O-antigen/teichoic acid export membrane protein|nr:oligosaccharide flippase family protein [Burkholderiales bacterium]
MASQNNSLTRNALANVLQMAISAILIFVLFRYINVHLGSEQFGVWSVVLATASISRFANLGLGVGVTRFVARYLALDDQKSAARIVETAVVALSVVLGIILISTYWLLDKLLAQVFTGTHLSQARLLLPYALFSLWLGEISLVFQSGLEGHQRMDVRAGITVLGQILMLIIAMLLVPSSGLLGLAEAQIWQGLFVLLAGWFMLRRMMPNLAWLPVRWSQMAFREFISYGVNVQLASVFILLMDPLTKMLMAKFGGASAAGYFEMANQVVLKVRALIVTANQAIVPKITQAFEFSQNLLGDYYKENIKILVFAALPIFTLIFFLTGPISLLLLGQSKPLFIHILQICTITWLLNIFAGPAYFINLGTGHVGWNTVSHMVMGLFNGILGLILGAMYGAEGVVWAYSLAIISGSWLLVFVFQNRVANTVRDLALRQHGLLVVTCITTSLVGSIMWNYREDYDTLYWIIQLFLLPLALTMALWVHPVRTELWQRFRFQTK